MAEHHLPCDITQEDGSEGCGSSDAMSIYSRIKKCYSCGRKESLTAEKALKRGEEELDQREELRGIEVGTQARYRSSLTEHEFRFAYGDDQGTIAAVKVRQADNKAKSQWLGKWRHALPLFGQDLFDPGQMYVTVTEGELDAMSSWQMHQGKGAHVSVRKGADGALADCREAFEWLDTFENIVLAFDADEQGQKAAADVAGLFGGKAKIVRFPPGYKDANAMLEAGKTRSYVQAWWRARPYSPDDVVDASDCADVFEKPAVHFVGAWPVPGLNEKLGGIGQPALYTVGAGTGVGKSELLRATVHKLLKEYPGAVGGLFLEESINTTIRALVGIEMGKPLLRPDAEFDLAEAQRVHADLMPPGKLHLIKHFALSAEAFLSKLRWFAGVAGCRVVVLDHISILMSALSAEKQSAQTLDSLLTQVRALLEQEDLTLIIASHLSRRPGKSHEEGDPVSLEDFRGSHGIAQLSDGVIALERNLQAEGDLERCTVHFRVLKNRLYSATGYAGSALYNPETGRYDEDSSPVL